MKRIKITLLTMATMAVLLLANTGMDISQNKSQKLPVFKTKTEVLSHAYFFRCLRCFCCFRGDMTSDDLNREKNSNQSSLDLASNLDFTLSPNTSCLTLKKIGLNAKIY
ncbi:MAG: hypothetical protein AAF518_26270 [Spirochaetota bacterium]